MDDNSNLATNKTVVFYSPLEKDDVTVRTGTLDNISFLHALLHAYSREYSHLENVERQTLVDRVYNDLLVVYEKHILSSNQKQLNKYTCEHLLELLSDKTNEVYEIFSELIPSDKLQTVFDTEEDVIQKLVDELETQLKTLLDEEERIKFCMEKWSELLKQSHIVAEGKLKPESLPLNKKIINMMGDYLDRDIYCLHYQTRLPLGERSSDYKKRKTIVVLQVENVNGKKKYTKYEVVGKLLPENRVQREFHHRDGFVKRIRVFLYEPVRFVEDYPDLADYLPEGVYTKSPEKQASPRHSPYRSAN